MKKEPKKTRADIKICVVGNSGTGKTSFCKRWVHGTFGNLYKATVLVDFQFKLFEYKGYYYKVQFWDIAGQDKNVYTTKVFTKNSHGTFYLCDITDPNTLEQTLKWKNSVDENTKFLDGEVLPSFIIQNKIDLFKQAKVNSNKQILEEFCDKNNFDGCMQVSCKTGKNVEEAMYNFLSSIIDRLEDYYQKNNINITDVGTNRIIRGNDLYTGANTEGGCC